MIGGEEGQSPRAELEGWEGQDKKCRESEPEKPLECI